MRSPHAARIEAEHGKPLREVLIELHYVRQLSHAEIAVALGVPRGTVPGWFARLGIADGQLATAKAHELAGRPPAEEVAS